MEKNTAVAQKQQLLLLLPPPLLQSPIQLVTSKNILEKAIILLTIWNIK